MFNPSSTEAHGQGKHLAFLELLTNEDFLGQELNNQLSRRKITPKITLAKKMVYSQRFAHTP